MKLIIIYAISAALAVGAVVLTMWLADAIKKLFNKE